MDIAGRSGPGLAAGLDDPVAVLVGAVGGALETVDPPSRPCAASQLRGYLGDVVEIAFNGSDRDRIALLARLVHLSATAGTTDDGGDRQQWLQRLERLLRRWDAERRRAAAPPRPRPADLETRVALLHVACAGQPLVLIELAALETAELTAIHLLAGTTTVESALAALDELAPLLDAARFVLEHDADERERLFRRPGETLAQLEELARQGALLAGATPHDDERRWLARLPLDAAAALLFAQDAYEQRDDHERSWSQVRDGAVELMTIGRLAERPAMVDLPGAIDEARSTALALAGHWLDEERGDAEDRVARLRPRVVAACSRCLVAAWAQQRVAAGC